MESFPDVMKPFLDGEQSFLNINESFLDSRHSFIDFNESSNNDEVCYLTSMSDFLKSVGQSLTSVRRKKNAHFE